MNASDSLPTRVAEALQQGLASAAAAGSSSVEAEHLAPEQLDTLAEATLAHLRSRRGTASDIEGWTLVTARDAAVMAWWTQVSELSTSERRRLETLRQHVYDVLVDRTLVVRDTDHTTSLHVSPAAQPRTWILKLSPYLYDVNRVFGAPDRRVRLWSVEDHERSMSMEQGDLVYLWVGEGDPYREAGVWGAGHVAGPIVLGVADDGWLDYEAASRASTFVVVDIALLDAPVTRETFLDDSRLVDAEVIRDPFAPNPGVLTATEAAALAEYLPSDAVPDQPQVA
ncbi:hypothetical protein ACWEOW_07410 [Monashia sp. NPDC004114]